MILLSKIAVIQVWKKLKLYNEAPISAQILPAIKSNEQLLTDSQCNEWDYIDINYFIGPKFQRKRCRHNGICTLCLISPRRSLGENRWHGPKNF